MDTNNNNENLKKETESVKEDGQKKKNIMTVKLDDKVVAFLLCGLGGLCLIIGVILNVTSNNKDVEPPHFNQDNNNINNNNNNEDNKVEEEVDDGVYRKFSSYKNFELTSNINMINGTQSFDIVERNKYDMVSNLFYVETDFMGTLGYEYHDFDSKLVYSSIDNETWIKYVDSNMSSPHFLSNIIDRIEKNEDVTLLSENSYMLNIDIATIPDTDGYVGVVPTVVVFDIKGFLTDIEFDFSSLTPIGDVIITKVTYKLSNINQVDSISIPREVLFGAVESE